MKNRQSPKILLRIRQRTKKTKTKKKLVKISPSQSARHAAVAHAAVVVPAKAVVVVPRAARPKAHEVMSSLPFQGEGTTRSPLPPIPEGEGEPSGLPSPIPAVGAGDGGCPKGAKDGKNVPPTPVTLIDKQVPYGILHYRFMRIGVPMMG
jgi:hypothetical protein